MSTFGDDLIQSLNEALAHAKGDGPAILHAPVTPREVRELAAVKAASLTFHDRRWRSAKGDGPAR